VTSPLDEDEPQGSGLQSERTYLAWQRTGLAFLGAGALLVRAGGGLARPLEVIPGLFGMAVSAVVFVRGLLRYRATSAVAAGETGLTQHIGVAAVALAASILCLSGLVVVLLAL
jgi:uncharacterized membrane protein YidH (DUF202 family)